MIKRQPSYKESKVPVKKVPKLTKKLEELLSIKDKLKSSPQSAILRKYDSVLYAFREYGSFQRLRFIYGIEINISMRKKQLFFYLRG